VEAAGFGQDFVDRCLDRLFFCDIGLDGEDLAGVLLGDGGKFVAGFTNINGVDF
jgi:hypothetical protein